MTFPIIPTVAFALLVGFVIYRFFISPAFLSPISRIPNAHWTAPFSPLWILYHRLKQNDTRAVHKAHTKHGPVIRLAPNELSVNCVEDGIRTIYGSGYGGGFDKGEWYPNVFKNYGIKPMFAMPERACHSKRKRMISIIYGKSAVQESEAVAAISRELLQQRLTSRLKMIADANKPVEAYSMFGAITMDFVAAYVFGLENGSDFIRQPERAAEFLKLYKSRQVHAFWPQELPKFTNFMKRIGLMRYIVPAWVPKANQDIEAWILAMCDKAEQSLAATESPLSPKDYPTVYAHLRQCLVNDATKSDLDVSVEEIVQSERLEMASELLDHIGAGFDTSSITLTWLAWELSRNSFWQTRLRDEIASLKDRNDPKEIDNLQILNACLKETLRLHAPLPGNQPRMTPPGTILGSFSSLPAGIRVQSQAWSLHRNPKVFPDSEFWNPDRWLTADETSLKDMDKWFWAFSSGGKMCVGRNLATLEMKNVMVSIWGQFSTDVADDEGMVHNGGYLAEPIGKNGKFLLLRFKSL